MYNGLLKRKDRMAIYLNPYFTTSVEGRLPIEKRGWIVSKINELAEKLSINRPVELIEVKGLAEIATAHGNAILPSRIGISINPEIAAKIPEDMLEFILAHELSHIAANDDVSTKAGATAGLVLSIVTFAMHVRFSWSSQPVKRPSTASSSVLTASLVVAAIALVLFSKWREVCADKRALSICSSAAKIAAPKLFEKIRSQNLECRNDKNVSVLSSLWRKLLTTKDGNDRLDVFHPSLTYRIRYLGQM